MLLTQNRASVIVVEHICRQGSLDLVFAVGILALLLGRFLFFLVLALACGLTDLVILLLLLLSCFRLVLGTSGS